MDISLIILQQGSEYHFIWHPQMAEHNNQSVTGHLCCATTVLAPHQQSELQAAIDSAAQVAEQMRQGSPDNSLSLQRLGRLLFSHLLPPALQERIRRLPEGTRLSLCTNNSELPWELIHDDQEFLALRHLVTRQMITSSGGHVSPLPSHRSLNCLLIGNPNNNLAAADAEVESLLDLFQSASQQTQVEFLCREHATKMRVMAALASGAYDIVHFACHARPGALSLADGWLDADEIKSVLRGRPFVFLNGCSSGRSMAKEHEYQHEPLPFAGQQTYNLAEAFLTGGASAFVGTAWPVSDNEIRWLALEFYHCLLNGHSFASALHMARTRSRSRNTSTTSWSAPVLYSDLHHRLPYLSLQRQPGTLLTARFEKGTQLAAGEDAYAQEVQRFASQLVTIIQSYGGNVVTIRPEYLQAIFGLPEPVEDDATRAIRAALEIRALTEQQSEECALAITSGEIVMTPLSSQAPRRTDHDQDVDSLPLYMGAVFDEAEQLIQQCRRNQILANHRARRLAVGNFVFVSLTATDSPDYPPQYEVSALVDDGSLRVEHAERQENGQIIGRERELAILSDHWQKVTRGGGHVIGIVGEAGVGKSRLLSEYLRSVAPTDHRWIGLACLSTGQDTPYALLGQLLRRIFGILPGDKEETVEAKIAQRLGELSGSGTTSVATDSQMNQILREALGLSTSELPVDERRARRGRLVHLLRTLMANTAQRQPLLLTIDDIHWIDEASLEILAQVTDGIQRLPVQLVIAYRPEWQHNWFGKAYYHHLPIDQLDRVASLELLCALLQSEQLPKGLSVLLQKTGGNPFFIKEMVKSLQESDILVQRAAPSPTAKATWELQRPLAEHQLPGTVERALRVRLEALSSTAREVLEAAATIGPSFSAPLLRKLLETMAEEVDFALTELEQRGFIEASWELQEYHFRHALILDTVYQNMPPGQLQAWHRRIAEALESGEVWQGVEVETLAHHYYHALLLSRPLEPPKLDPSSNPQQVAKAVTCLTHCGQRALERFAMREAINYYQRALFLHSLLPSGSASEVTCHEGLGDAYNTLGDFEAAYQHFRLAYGILHTRPLTKADRRRATDLARRLGRVCAWRGEHDEAIAWMREGQRTLGEPEDDEDKAIAALLHVHTGSVEYNRGNHSQVLLECEQGLALAREIERPLPAQAEADNLLGIMAWANGRSQEALLHYARSRDTWLALGNSYQATRVEGNMGVAYFHLAQWEQARVYHTRCKEYWEHIEDQDMLAHPCLNLGNIYLYQGNWEQAELHYRYALSLWSQAHHKRFTSLGHTNLGLLYIEQEDWAKAQAQLEESYTILTTSNIRDLLSEVLSALAEVALGQGRLTDAMQYALQARDLAQELEMRSEEALALRILGRIHLACQEMEDARISLQQALDIFHEIANQYEAARTLVRLAEAEMQAGHSLNAHALLEQAHSIFCELGANHDCVHAEQLMLTTEISNHRIL